MTELKPCPFCGAEAQLKIHKHFSGDFTVTAGCPKCVRIRFAYLGGKNEGMKKVIADWNRRSYE